MQNFVNDRNLEALLMEHSTNYSSSDLHSKCSQNNAAEDRVPEDAIKHVPFTVNLASIDLVEELHQDKGIEDDGVVFRWGGV